MDDRPTLSIIVPVYKCGDSLPELVRRAKEAAAPIVARLEIILVDDACPQDSWKVIESLQARHEEVTGLKLPENGGQANAIAEGIARAANDLIVVLDGDLQDPPERLPAFVKAAAANGWDIVFGDREERCHSAFRKMLSGGYRMLAPVLGMPDMRRFGSFTLLTRRAVEQYLQRPERRCLFITTLTWLDLPRSSVAYTQARRAQGTSSYSIRHLLRLCLLRLFARRIPRFVFSMTLLLSLVLWAVLASCGMASSWPAGVAIATLSWLLVETAGVVTRRVCHLSPTPDAADGS